MSSEGEPFKDGDQYLPMKDGDQYFSIKDGDQYLPMKDGDQYLPMKDGDQYLPMKDGDLTGNNGSLSAAEQYTYVTHKPRSASSAVQPQTVVPDTPKRHASSSSAPKTPLKAVPSASDMYVYHEQEAAVVTDYEVPVTNEYEMPIDASQLLASHNHTAPLAHTTNASETTV